MQFGSWPFLFLLILIPLFHLGWLNRNKPARVRFSLAIPKNVAQKSPLKILLYLKYLGLVFLIIALARPQSSFKQMERTVSGIDILLVLDVSASMYIEDLAERSRFEVAKDTIETFIKNRQNDRIGFVIFSGEPLTMAPPTLDYGLLLRSLRETKIGVLKDGTAIGDGLALGLSHLKSSRAKTRVVVLLTDGDNNLGQVDPATAGELAAGYGIKVYTIAIGREGRVKMPIRHQGLLGNVVTTYQWFENALNPEILQQISKTTGAKFYRVTDESTLGSVFREIDQLEKSDVKARENVRFEEKFQWPLKLGLIVLLIEQILQRLWWRFLL